MNQDGAFGRRPAVRALNARDERGKLRQSLRESPVMTTAYFCILIAALLPYLWVAIAKQSGQRYDNREPRSWMARQDNPRVLRANAAQLNAFEAFAPFAAAVLMAQAAGVDGSRISQL